MATSNLGVRIETASPAPRPEPVRGVAIFLHGWTGDEHSMDILERGLAAGWWRISLRGPFEAGPGGFSWSLDHGDAGVPAAAFRPAAGALREWVKAAPVSPDLPLVLVGFSQGAALAFASVGERLVRPAGLAVLAGFLPPGITASAFVGVPIFWSHGLRDDRVPVDRARGEAALLEQTGARVTYCEADVGHKVGLTCVRGLRTWLADLERASGA